MTKSILVVEDDQDTMTLISQTLEAEGYCVLTAKDGQQALDWVGVAQPDLVLLDMMLPLMNGYEVLTRLKSLPATARIPVIGLSALCDRSDVELACSLGAEGYITKPFRVSHLLSAIRGHLHR